MPAAPPARGAPAPTLLGWAGARCAPLALGDRPAGTELSSGLAALGIFTSPPLVPWLCAVSVLRGRGAQRSCPRRCSAADTSWAPLGTEGPVPAPWELGAWRSPRGNPNACPRGREGARSAPLLCLAACEKGTARGDRGFGGFYGIVLSLSSTGDVPLPLPGSMTLGASPPSAPHTPPAPQPSEPLSFPPTPSGHKHRSATEARTPATLRGPQQPQQPAAARPRRCASEE